MIFAKLYEIVTGLYLYKLGIYPLRPLGLLGIIFAPFIHADLTHLISNLTSLAVLLFVLLYLYRQSAYWVLLISWLGSGLGIWLFAREAYHIGASGILYALVAFIFFSGLLRKDKRAIALSLLVTFLYGSMVWGVLPIDERVSFEAHLFGAICGIICAIAFRKLDPVPAQPADDEEDENNEDGFENDIDPDKIKIDDDASPRYF